MDKSAREYLLALARYTINANLGISTQITRTNLPDGHYGAFVTLHKDNQLRGCIGSLEGRSSLESIIPEMAVSAAFHDPRFPPVRASEVALLTIEISILTPLEPCPDPEAIIVGKHGLYLTQGLRGGVFLPQVPVEQDWDRNQYLFHLCRKAGLPPDAWKNPESRLYWFEAEVFAEP
jgi:AmmeMemoRadiSam system protein A